MNLKPDTEQGFRYVVLSSLIDNGYSIVLNGDIELIVKFLFNDIFQYVTFDKVTTFNEMQEWYNNSKGTICISAKDYKIVGNYYLVQIGSYEDQLVITNITKRIVRKE